MKIKFKLLLVLVCLAGAHLYSQCTFTAGIAVSGSTLGCGTRTLTANSSGNNWTQRANYSGSARSMAVAFSIGSKGYIGTGIGTSNVIMSDFWEYDPATNSWSQKANFGGGNRYGAVGFAIGAKGYVGTGYFSGYQNDFWEYDPTTNFWNQKASFSGTARYLAAGFSINGNGYIGTGANWTSYTDFWEYNPNTNFWTQKAAFAGPARYGAAAFSINSKGYIGTGYTSSSGSLDFWEYDPTLDLWTQKANVGNAAMYGATAFSMSNKGYIGTGYEPSNGAASNKLWEYDPLTNTWVQVANMGTGNGRQYASAFSIGQKGYVGTGILSSTYLATFWEYEGNGTYAWSTGETTQAITATTSATYSVLITTAAGCTASATQDLALSPNPTLTVTGGSVGCAGLSNTLTVSGATTYTWSANAGGGNATTAIVTPTNNTTYTVSGTTGTCVVDYQIPLNVYAAPVATIAVSGSTVNCGTLTLNTNAGGNTWTQKAGLNVGREFGVGFNIGAKGYMGTGYNGNSSPYYYNDFWEYDPATNAWTQKANFTGGARYGAIGLGIGSKGYVGTGYDNSSGLFKNDFWEYDPATNTWTQKASLGSFGRYLASAFSIGSKGYIGTGASGFSWNSGLNDFWEYDPSSNVWTQKTSLGGAARYAASGFALGSKGYIGTGYNGGYLSDFWEYDPTNNSWTQRANYAGGGTQGAVSFNIGNRGYIGTGETNSGVTNTFYEYNATTDAWTQKAAFGGVARVYANGFAIGSRGYLGIGYKTASPYYMNDLWQYDPSTTILWSNNSTLSAIPVSASGSYSVTITNAAGCSASASQSVALSPNPTISVSGGTNVLCGGSSNTLTASGATTYTWSSNAGGSNSSSVIVSPNVSTTYTVTGTTGTCSVNYIIPLSVNATPVATISVSGSTVNCGTLTLNTNAGGNTWTQKAGLNVGRTQGVAFNIGNKGYMGTGYNGNTSPYYFSDFWEYDPTTNAWTQKANFGGGQRSMAVGFSIGSKGYIGTGYDYNFGYRNDFWEYDPANNTWTQKANISTFPRYYATGFGIGSKGYIGTGYNTSSGIYMNDFWEFDPSTNTWVQKANFGGTSRFRASSFVVGAKGYIGTGYASGYLGDFWEYDQSNNTWTQKANYGGAIGQNMIGFALANKGYMGTGEGNSGYTNEFWEYDPASNTWLQKANFGGTMRGYASAFAIGNKGYVGLGSIALSPTYMNDLWQYDPSTTILWSNSATLQAIPVSTSGTYSVTITNAAGCSASAAQSVSLSPNPTISVSGASIGCAGTSNTLVASGASTYTWSSNAGSSNSNSVIVSPSASTVYTVSGTTGSCTVNFPVALNVNAVPVATIAVSGPTLGCGTLTLNSNAGGNTWTQKAGLNVGRMYGVGFNIGNKGYMGTGYNNNTSPYVFNDFWEYDPSTNAWTQKANFGGGLRYYAVGFSIGSKGYVGTGYDATNNVYKNDFWEYDPANNTWTQKANVSSVLRYNAVGFGIGTKGYIGTGNSTSWSTAFNDFWEYDPSNNTWTQKTNFGGSTRTSAAAFVIGSKGYIGTGYNPSTGYTNDFWEYDPSNNTWTQKANYAGGAISSAKGFAIGGMGYFGTGESNSISYNNSFYEYNPSTNAWTQKANFGGTGRIAGSSFAIGNKGYMGLGYNGNNSPYYMNDLWQYDPTNTILWSTTATVQAIPVSTSGTYSVTITNAAGCSASASQVVALSPNPTISVSGGTTIVCGGTSNTLVASGATTYTWSSNAGGSNSNSVIVSPSAPTVYTLSGSTGSCTVNYPIALNVIQSPTANILVIGQPSICGTAITLSTSATLGNTWTQKSGLNTARAYAIGFSIGNKGYIGTGANFNIWPYYQSDLWEYDPSTNSWTQKANFTGGQRYGATGFSIGNKGYLCAGYDVSNSLYKNDLWEYDPSLNTWVQKASFGGLSRMYATGFVLGTKAYVGSGVDLNGSLKNDFWEYDQPTNTWVQKASMGTARQTAFAFGIGSKGYVGGGASSFSTLNDLWEYDPVLNFWTQKTSVGSVGREGAGAFVIGSKAYVGAGNTTSDFWEYNPGTNTWLQKANFSGLYRYNTVAFAIGGKGYMGTGQGGNFYGDLWEYDPSTTLLWSNGSSVSTMTATSSGMYSLTLTNASGCSNVDTQSLTITPTPTIVITGASSLCAGKTITLSASGANSYTWSANAGSATTSTISVSPASNTSYGVNGAANGCTATAVKSILVNALPAVTASATSVSVCDGKTVTLYGGGASTYTWTGGITNNTPFMPTASGDYTVTGTSANTCTNTAVISLTVKPSPTVSVSGGTICAGESFTFQPNGAVNYTYSGGSAVVAPNVTTTYSITGFNSVGCPNTAVATVTASPLPVITVTSGVVCAGDSFTILANGASSYTYSGGSQVVTPSATTVYIVTGTSPAGCINSTGTPVNVTVSALPVISVNSGTICNGKSFTITPTGASSYTYSGGSNVVSPNTTTSYSVTGANIHGCVSPVAAVSQVSVLATPSITLPATAFICTGNTYTISPSGAASYTYSSGSNIVTPAATTNYTVTGTSSQGCSAAPAVITVSVTPSLTVTINGPNAACLGYSITLTGNGANTFTWSTGEVSTSIMVSPSSVTMYSVNAGSSTCGGTASVMIGVNPNPTVTAFVTRDLICANETTTINASGASTYTWNGGNSTSAELIVAPAVTTTYIVTGFDANGCYNTAAVTQEVSECTGISEAEKQSTSINVYPNPGTGILNIEMSSLPENAIIELHNYMGQLIVSERMNGTASQLDYTQASNGMYTLKVMSNGKCVFITKIVKQ